MQELSVSSLVRYLKYKLDSDNNLQKVTVIGEISNFHRHYSGHLYFSLKDESAQINCVMFKSSASSLKFEPKNGDKVIAVANTSIFEGSGQLQLYIQKMNIDGLGDLYAQYEALKAKLEEQGYFSQEHKIELEREYVNNVAVLVGDNSAAMSDIKTMFKRRWPLCKVDYYPVLVQGNNAPEIIINKLNDVDKLNYDAIILARGGGSFEDLFCFNDENLVKCIYGLETFIITGIGHEQDFTLADFVADLKAPTPTASVELITPNINDVIDSINVYIDLLNKNINNKIYNYNLKFDYMLEKIVHYQDYLNNKSLQIDKIILNIKQSIIQKIKLNNKDLDLNDTRMQKSIDFKLNTAHFQYKRLNTLLEAYNSQNVLDRGYTLVYQNGKIIKKRNDIEEDLITIKFSDGNIDAKIQRR